MNISAAISGAAAMENPMATENNGRIAVFAKTVEGKGFVPVDPDKIYSRRDLSRFADDDGDVHVTTMPDRSKG